MAKNKEIFFTKDGRLGSANSSTTATGALIFNAGTEGSKLLMLTVASKSSVPTNIEMFIDGVRVLLLVSSTPNIGDNLFNNVAIPKDRNGNPYLNIPAGAAVNIKNSGSGNVTVGYYVEDY